MNMRNPLPWRGEEDFARFPHHELRTFRERRDDAGSLVFLLHESRSLGLPTVGMSQIFNGQYKPPHATVASRKRPGNHFPKRPVILPYLDMFACTRRQNLLHECHPSCNPGRNFLSSRVEWLVEQIFGRIEQDLLSRARRATCRLQLLARERTRAISFTRMATRR